MTGSSAMSNQDPAAFAVALITELRAHGPDSPTLAAMLHEHRRPRTDAEADEALRFQADLVESLLAIVENAFEGVEELGDLLAERGAALPSGAQLVEVRLQQIGEAIAQPPLP